MHKHVTLRQSSHKRSLTRLVSYEVKLKETYLGIVEV